MRAVLTRPEWRGFAIFALLVAIFVVRLFVDTPGLSLVFLAAFPIVLAGFALDRTAAVACAVLATVLSVLVQIISPAAEVSAGAQIVGGAFRGVVFVGLAVLVSSLVERTAALRQRLAESEQEVRELESLRAALTAPELPAVRGLTIATSYTPADGLVAGDFFLVAPGAEGAALVVVGDVVGHGLEAARRASFVRTTIALFAEYTNDPMTILRLANTALAEREPGTEFVTALCAIFSADRATVTWASAGHPPPWDLDRGEPLPNVHRCLPLGVEPALEGDAMTTRLLPGSGVLLFTDGLTEARTARATSHHALFGERAARQTLRDLRGSSPQEIVAALRTAAVRHAQGTPADDLCLVAVRFDSASAAHPQAA
ncbi:MAG TPA: PP2C family protein-serine/threonine phosphatase [Solirubrobacteraceae bacterium]